MTIQDTEAKLRDLISRHNLTLRSLDGSLGIGAPLTAALLQALLSPEGRALLGDAAAQAEQLDRAVSGRSAYRYTAAAEDFVATADSRETSREIMRAIVAFAKDTAEAVTIWEEGLTNWDDESKLAFVNTVTSDGIDAADSFVWGAAGSQWAGADYDQSPLQEA